MIARRHSILLDSEALSALARGERRMQAWAVVARRTDSALFASTVVLAEATDGTARDAGVRRAAKTLRLLPVTDAIGYLAGGLRAAAGRSRRKPRDLTVDAIVAATALSLPGRAVVLTADPEDIALLLAMSPVKVEAI
jgi:predicted nucleic acid-binding protein